MKKTLPPTFIYTYIKYTPCTLPSRPIFSLACSKGGGGKWCDFHVKEISEGVVALRSVHGDWGVGFRDDGTPKPADNVGEGPGGQLVVIPAGPFEAGKKYRLRNVKTGKNVAVMPEDKHGVKDMVHAHGGAGPHATLTVSTLRGAYQFKADSGRFLACKEHDGSWIRAGGGGNKCDFAIVPHDGNFLIRSVHNEEWGIAFNEDGDAKANPATVKQGKMAQFSFSPA